MAAYPTLCCKEIQVPSEIRGMLPYGILLQTRLKKCRHGTWIVERAINLADYGGRSERDKLHR